MAILGYSNNYLLSPGGGFYLRTYDEDELYSKFFISGYFGVWHPTADEQHYYSESDIRTWNETFSGISSFTSILYPTYVSGVTAEPLGVTSVNSQYWQPKELSIGNVSNVGTTNIITANHFYKMPYFSAKDVDLHLHGDHVTEDLYSFNIDPILSLTATKTGTVNKNTFPATWENIHAEKYSYNVYDVQVDHAEGFPSAESGYYWRRYGAFDVSSQGSYIPSAFDVHIKMRDYGARTGWRGVSTGEVPFRGKEMFIISGKIPR